MRQKYYMTQQDREAFMGDCAWFLIKASFWMAIGYWIGKP